LGTLIRYGQCWSLFGTQSLGMDSAGRYWVQSLGMDSAGRYSVHSH
jgi:hypothetical protein